MKTIKGKLKKLDPKIVSMAVEYIIDIWVILATILNLLNKYDISHFDFWLMKPTFFGQSLLVLLLLQYGLLRSNKQNQILNRMRPYVMGLIAADIVSACNLSLCLMLLLVIGYLLVSGFPKKCGAGEAAMTALLACVAIEIYGIAMLMQKGETEGCVAAFLKSAGPDVLLAVGALLYYLATRTDRTEEEEESKESEGLLTRMWKGLEAKAKGLVERFEIDFRQVVRYAGGILCVVSLGLFLYFAVSVGVGVRKIANSAEEVYLLRHCEDPSYVLTVERDDETDTYGLSFEKYSGKNNQKICLRDTGEGMSRILFVESGYALGANEQMEPYADLEGEFSLHGWIREVRDGEQGLYRLVSGYGVPLCHGRLEKGVSNLAIGYYEGYCEVFSMERTTEDEFATKMVADHRSEFMPTSLMETMSTLLGGWMSLLYIFITLLFFTIIYLRRIVGDKLAALYALLFAYMLAYGSISAILLHLAAVGFQCCSNHGYNRRKA